MSLPHATPQGEDLWEFIGAAADPVAAVSTRWTPALQAVMDRLGISPDLDGLDHPPMVSTLAPSSELGVMGSLVIPVKLTQDFGFATTLKSFLDPMAPGDPRDPLDLLFSRMHRCRSSEYQAEYRVSGILVGFVDPAAPGLSSGQFLEAGSRNSHGKDCRSDSYGDSSGSHSPWLVSGGFYECSDRGALRAFSQ